MTRLGDNSPSETVLWGDLMIELVVGLPVSVTSSTRVLTRDFLEHLYGSSLMAAVVVCGVVKKFSSHQYHYSGSGNVIVLHLTL